MRNLGYYGQLFLLSLFFQQVQGYSALGTGAAFLPLTATIAPGSLLAGRLYERIGPRLLIAVGLALSSVSALAMALINAKTSYASIFGMLIAAGFGVGLLIASHDGGPCSLMPQKSNPASLVVFSILVYRLVVCSAWRCLVRL